MHEIVRQVDLGSKIAKLNQNTGFRYALKARDGPIERLASFHGNLNPTEARELQCLALWSQVQRAPKPEISRSYNYKKGIIKK